MLSSKHFSCPSSALRFVATVGHVEGELRDRKTTGVQCTTWLKSCHNLTHVSNLQSLKRRRITLFSENIILQIILSKVIQCTASLRCNVVRKTGPNTTRCLGYLDTAFCRF